MSETTRKAKQTMLDLWLLIAGADADEAWYEIDSALDRLAHIEADRQHLLAYAVKMGLAMRPDADPDTANEAWRALPPHLQNEIERAEGSDE